jgi:hypothetical protein
LLQNFDLGWFQRTPDPIRAREAVESIRLLDRRHFAELFPNAEIYEEKMFGMIKSFVAYEGWND